MEVFSFLSAIIIILTIPTFFFFMTLILPRYSISSKKSNLPPGKMGFPFIGETLDFISTAKKGHPEEFIFKRMSKFSSQIFKTSLLGNPTVVLCGATGNKFLFTNEQTLVTPWWPNSVNKIFPPTRPRDHTLSLAGNKMRKMLPTFLSAAALKGYITTMDAVAQKHLVNSWGPKRHVTVHALSTMLSLELSCQMFLSMKEEEEIAKLGRLFHLLSAGIWSVPVDLPGTALNAAVKAAERLREEVRMIIRRRRKEGKEVVGEKEDILWHMMEGGVDDESEICNRILALLLGGIDTIASVITMLLYYLADLPHIYDRVYNEQMEIAKSKKEEGEMLNWEDIQKMKYSWNVVCEVMRISPPLPGTFRVALTDFTFAGFSIPKGLKLYWSTNATHKNPELFSEPERFDPSRFEGNGPVPYSYVPFGGGPRMCPGKEYARLVILIFLHNLVKRYRWEKLLDGGKINMNPMPMPPNGLPIRLIPHP